MTEFQQDLSPAHYDDVIDLRELFRVLSAGKWLIGGITIAATVIGVFIAIMLDGRPVWRPNTEISAVRRV